MHCRSPCCCCAGLPFDDGAPAVLAVVGISAAAVAAAVAGVTAVALLPCNQVPHTIANVCSKIKHTG